MTPKNILIITGSPRKNSNSKALSASFSKGAQESGHSVVVFDSVAKKVRPCIACDKCWSKNVPCIFDDAFAELGPLQEAADIIVFSSPLYWFTFSAQIKACIDKLYSYVVEQCPRPLQAKDAVLLMSAETDESAFDGVIKTYKATLGYLEWNDKGMVLAPEVCGQGEISGTKYLADAEELGRNI